MKERHSYKLSVRIFALLLTLILAFSNSITAYAAPGGSGTGTGATGKAGSITDASVPGIFLCVPVLTIMPLDDYTDDGYITISNNGGAQQVDLDDYQDYGYWTPYAGIAEENEFVIVCPYADTSYYYPNLTDENSENAVATGTYSLGGKTVNEYLKAMYDWEIDHDGASFSRGIDNYKALKKEVSSSGSIGKLLNKMSYVYNSWQNPVTLDDSHSKPIMSQAVNAMSGLTSTVNSCVLFYQSDDVPASEKKDYDKAISCLQSLGLPEAENYVLTLYHMTLCIYISNNDHSYTGWTYDYSYRFGSEKSSFYDWTTGYYVGGKRCNGSDAACSYAYAFGQTKSGNETVKYSNGREWYDEVSWTKGYWEGNGGSNDYRDAGSLFLAFGKNYSDNIFNTKTGWENLKADGTRYRLLDLRANSDTTLDECKSGGYYILTNDAKNYAYTKGLWMCIAPLGGGRSITGNVTLVADDTTPTKVSSGLILDDSDKKLVYNSATGKFDTEFQAQGVANAVTNSGQMYTGRRYYITQQFDKDTPASTIDTAIQSYSFSTPLTVTPISGGSTVVNAVDTASKQQRAYTLCTGSNFAYSGLKITNPTTKYSDFPDSSSITNETFYAGFHKADDQKVTSNWDSSDGEFDFDVAVNKPISNAQVTNNVNTVVDKGFTLTNKASGGSQLDAKKNQIVSSEAKRVATSVLVYYPRHQITSKLHIINLGSSFDKSTGKYTGFVDSYKLNELSASYYVDYESAEFTLPANTVHMIATPRTDSSASTAINAIKNLKSSTTLDKCSFTNEVANAINRSTGNKATLNVGEGLFGGENVAVGAYNISQGYDIWCITTPTDITIDVKPEDASIDTIDKDTVLSGQVVVKSYQLNRFTADIVNTATGFEHALTTQTKAYTISSKDMHQFWFCNHERTIADDGVSAGAQQTGLMWLNYASCYDYATSGGDYFSLAHNGIYCHQRAANKDVTGTFDTKGPNSAHEAMYYNFKLSNVDKIVNGYDGTNTASNYYYTTGFSEKFENYTKNVGGNYRFADTLESSFSSVYSFGLERGTLANSKDKRTVGVSDVTDDSQIGVLTYGVESQRKSFGDLKTMSSITYGKTITDPRLQEALNLTGNTITNNTPINLSYISTKNNNILLRDAKASTIGWESTLPLAKSNDTRRTLESTFYHKEKRSDYNSGDKSWVYLNCGVHFNDLYGNIYQYGNTLYNAGILKLDRSDPEFVNVKEPVEGSNQLMYIANIRNNNSAHRGIHFMATGWDYHTVTLTYYERCIKYQPDRQTANAVNDGNDAILINTFTKRYDGMIDGSLVFRDKVVGDRDFLKAQSASNVIELKYYPEVDMRFYYNTRRDARGNTDRLITSLNDISRETVKVMGDEERYSNSSGLYIFSVNTGLGKTNNAYRENTDDAINSTPAVDTKIAKGSTISSGYEVTTDRNSKPVIYAGSDVTLNAESNYTFNLYGYALDVTDKNDEGRTDEAEHTSPSGAVIPAKNYGYVESTQTVTKDNLSGATLDQIRNGSNTSSLQVGKTQLMKYNSLIVDQSDVYKDWNNKEEVVGADTNRNSQKLLKEYSDWATSMLQPKNFKVKIDLEITKADGTLEKTYDDFNVSFGKIVRVTGNKVTTQAYKNSYGDATTDFNHEDGVYRLTFKDGEVVRWNKVTNGAGATTLEYDSGYLALITQIADDANISVKAADELFMESTLHTTILNAIQSDTDDFNKSGVDDWGNAEDKEHLGNKDNWYDEEVKTIVVRRFKTDSVTISGCVLQDKLDYNLITTSSATRSNKHLGNWYYNLEFFNETGKMGISTATNYSTYFSGDAMKIINHKPIEDSEFEVKNSSQDAGDD